MPWAIRLLRLPAGTVGGTPPHRSLPGFPRGGVNAYLCGTRLHASGQDTPELDRFHFYSPAVGCIMAQPRTANRVE